MPPAIRAAARHRPVEAPRPQRLRRPLQEGAPWQVVVLVPRLVRVPGARAAVLAQPVPELAGLLLLGLRQRSLSELRWSVRQRLRGRSSAARSAVPRKVTRRGPVRPCNPHHHRLHRVTRRPRHRHARHLRRHRSCLLGRSD